MTSDIDELLEWLRKRRWAGCEFPPQPWIAVVEELVKNQATTVRLAPRVGLQPMAILDESDRRESDGDQTDT
ncbi:hypothetical protein LCGC14_1893220 [marine sediment metagenome]|uniref:Uncharacterized protein n=1 Tax=marine sediment metagenome TaxID=412755 RepID=A0A0F9ICP1_9ZZZZ